MKMDDNDKSIKTETFKITENVMSWDKTIIQLSNVSSISTEPLSAIIFPWYPLAAVMCFFGIKNLTRYGEVNLFGLFVLACGVCMIFWRYYKNLQRTQSTIMTICMNSGQAFHFLIEDWPTMQRIKNVLGKIIADGGIGKRSISINIKDCKIQDSDVFNNVKF